MRPSGMRRSLLALGFLVSVSAPAGAHGPQAQIIHGVRTTEFPFVVALIAAGEDLPFCTGSLISPSRVLTAAHCVCNTRGSDCQDLDPEGLDVFVPVLGRDTLGTLIPVSRIRVHPSYRPRRGDLATLELAEAVTDRAPLPLALGKPYNGTPAVVVGYGTMYPDANAFGGKRYGFVETSSCAGYAPARRHVCTFTETGETDTCSGDSGGPLLVAAFGGLELAGVTSFGDDDCQGPSAYTNVARYRRWIELP